MKKKKKQPTPRRPADTLPKRLGRGSSTSGDGPEERSPEEEDTSG